MIWLAVCLAILTWMTYELITAPLMHEFGPMPDETEEQD